MKKGFFIFVFSAFVCLMAIGCITLANAALCRINLPEISLDLSFPQDMLSSSDSVQAALQYTDSLLAPHNTLFVKADTSNFAINYVYNDAGEAVGIEEIQVKVIFQREVGCQSGFGVRPERIPDYEKEQVISFDFLTQRIRTISPMLYGKFWPKNDG